MIDDRPRHHVRLDYHAAPTDPFAQYKFGMFFGAGAVTGICTVFVLSKFALKLWALIA